MSLYKWIIITESCFPLLTLSHNASTMEKNNFWHIAVTLTLSNIDSSHVNSYVIYFQSLRIYQDFLLVIKCDKYSSYRTHETVLGLFRSSWFISRLTMFGLWKHQLAITWKSIRLCFLCLKVKFKKLFKKCIGLLNNAALMLD